jgi:anti-sigma factor RsiW
MPHEAFSDETLMAYADGELDAETVLAIENALEVDPVLAGRLAVFTGTRDVLAHAARARPPEPVPDDLMARVWATLDEAADREVDTVTPFLARKIGNGPRNAWWPTALAASLALAFGLGAGYFLARDTAPGPAPLQVALLETEGLEPALSQLLSGEERQLPAGVLRMIASFRDDRGGVLPGV